MQEDAQVALVSQLATMYGEIDLLEHRGESRRYWYDNHSFGVGDAVVLHLMLRHLRPARMIEVGSGFSSCVTLDTLEHWLGWQTELTLIEPHPEQLYELLRPGDREHFTLMEQPVQSVPVELFRTLGSGDVLFLDSTHVSRVGSDVNYEIFDVLPALESGVYIHFHDVFYPFEYPSLWVEEGRAWTETYLLHAFLQYNDAFEIVLWNHMLDARHRKLMSELFPLWLRNTGGSIWLRKR